jgi:hypothetical protein
VEKAVDAVRHQRREVRIVDRREIHQHIRGRAARSRLAQERRDVEVARCVHVAAAGKRFGGGYEIDTRLNAAQRDLRCVPSRGSQRSGPGIALLVGVARELHGGREPPVGRGVVVGESQEALREGGPGRVRPGMELGVLGVLRPAHRQGGDHRDQAGAQARRHS